MFYSVLLCAVYIKRLSKYKSVGSRVGDPHFAVYFYRKLSRFLTQQRNRDKAIISIKREVFECAFNSWLRAVEIFSKQISQYSLATVY